MTEAAHIHQFEWAEPVPPSKAEALAALAVLKAYLDREVPQ